MNEFCSVGAASREVIEPFVEHLQQYLALSPSAASTLPNLAAPQTPSDESRAPLQDIRRQLGRPEVSEEMLQQIFALALDVQRAHGSCALFDEAQRAQQATFVALKRCGFPPPSPPPVQRPVCEAGDSQLRV